MEIRDLTQDDFDAALDIRMRSFGPLSDSDREKWRAAAIGAVAAGRYIGVYDGDRLTAVARLRAFTQWWHGRPQPMAGIGSVTVSPEERGKGVGTLLMKGVIERAAELGDAISALYPATTPIYRSVGYEHAGAQNTITLKTEALRRIRPTGQVKLRRMGPDDAAELIEVMGRANAAARVSGPISWDEATWKLWLAEQDDFLYLADDGFAVYRWNGGSIEVDSVVAASEETTRALWSLIGTASSLTEQITAAVAPDDPVLWLVGERSKDAVKQVRWMQRLIDLPAAIERRGYPAALAAHAVVRVDDPLRPGNDGTWRLEVAGGSGGATAEGDAGSGVPRLSINGMSALYAGVPVATLRRTGLMTGAGRHDDALDTIFAAKAHMLDYF
ncbi:GNAT family N-acetyltransferase [Nonomuraea sp. NBC_01738]|uniref:GNAT family N-acetyltransferase n=1 Tax=Nonomuraea sp. NBC_01738 TaxID=2976003 RepID=UPI002E130BE7|nr:GNAT family N-acetyltransferase [Nonomuraea sp. NBC_01738]